VRKPAAVDVKENSRTSVVGFGDTSSLLKICRKVHEHPLFTDLQSFLKFSMSLSE
jgi:hypothetical protein